MFNIINNIIISYFNGANMAGGTSQFGHNLGKAVQVLLSQIQAYVFEFNLSHQTQQTAYKEMVSHFAKKISLLYYIANHSPKQ